MMPVNEAENMEMLTAYRIFRERIAQEDNLVHQRMSWVLSFSTILLGLFGALTVVQIKDLDKGLGFREDIIYLMRSIPVFGVAGSLLGLISISAALDEIEHLRKVYRQNFPQNAHAEDEERIPSLVGHKHNHRFGKAAPFFIPTVIIMIWVVLNVFAWNQFVP